MTLFVELAVVRKIGLRDDGKCAASVNCNGAIVEGCSLAQWRADDDQGEKIRAGSNDGGQRALDLIKKNILKEKIIDCIPRNAQLREECDRDAAFIAASRGCNDFFSIGQWLCGMNGERHCRHARKALVVKGMEVHGFPPESLGLLSPTWAPCAFPRP